MSHSRIIEVASIVDNKLKCNFVDFFTVLDKIGSRKFCVLSLNGRTRCGKSFMASQFIKFLSCQSRSDWILQQNTGSLPWNSSADLITQGIQIWHEPFFISHEGEEIAVLVLDTRGLLDYVTTYEQSALLFAFSNLLSSYFIFNDSISSEDVFEFLHVFLKYSKVTCNTDGSRKLLFLRRDWQNDHEFSFGYHSSTEIPIGSKENLKKFMFDVNQANLTTDAMTNRRGISELSKDIGVYALPTPDVIPDPNVPAENWDPMFRSEIVKFVEWIFSDYQISSSLMQIRGHTVTGCEFKTFVTEWSNILQNCDELPSLQSLEISTINLIGTNLLTACLEDFRKQIVSLLEGHIHRCAQAQFEDFAEQIRTVILANFDGNDSLGFRKENFRLRLLSELNIIQNTMKEQHDAKLRLEAKRTAAKQKAEMERVRRIQAEIDFSANAAAAEAADQRRAAADRERSRQKQARIAALKEEIERTKIKVTAALGNLQSVMFNYKESEVTINVKTEHRGRRIFGSVISHTSTTDSHHTECRFNVDTYKQAKCLAQKELDDAFDALINANTQLVSARDA